MLIFAVAMWWKPSSLVNYIRVPSGVAVRLKPTHPTLTMPVSSALIRVSSGSKVEACRVSFAYPVCN